jgi:hypothetical protein
MEPDCSSSPAPPPASLRIAAGLCVFAGAVALMEVVLRWLRQDVFFQFEVFLIPIGICLLRGGRRAWWTMIVPSLVVAGIFAWLIVAGALEHGAVFWQEFFPAKDWTHYTLSVLEPAMFFVIPLLLLSKRTRSWLKAQSAPVHGHFAWLVVPLLAGLFAGIAAAAAEREKLELAESFFRFETEITVLNDETGQPLGSVEFHWPSSESGGDPVRRKLEPRIGSMFTDLGRKVRIDGISGRPFTVGIGADGMATETVEIDRHTPSALTVRLKKKQPDDAETRSAANEE